MSKLELVPITQDEAFEFVRQNHRHHRPPVGSLFQVAAAEDGKIVGVAVVGRPVARHLDKDGYTAEVTRLCTDGTRNVCSFLYSAAWRVAKNMGYRRLITYILKSESGGSLEASGWKRLYETRGGSWSNEKRPRIDKHPLMPKICFEKTQDLTNACTVTIDVNKVKEMAEYTRQHGLKALIKKK
jgi:hypothetical protein